ncbi:MAG: preprotein translocase subunit SecG [Ruminococcus sp.]|nr:preprotein translocase subunit SecG [Ruminococcus sp.]
MSVIEIICGVILILVSIVLIVLCLMQDTKSQDGMTSAIGGGNNTSFYDQNTGRTKEAILAKATKVCAIIFFIVTLLATIVPKFLG